MESGTSTALVWRKSLLSKVSFVLICGCLISLQPQANAVKVEQPCLNTGLKRFLNKSIIFVLNEAQSDSTHYEFYKDFIFDMSHKFPNSSFSLYFLVSSDKPGKERYKVVFENASAENVTWNVLQGRGERALSRSEFSEQTRNTALVMGIDMPPTIKLCDVAKFCLLSFWGKLGINHLGSVSVMYMDVTCACLNVFLNRGVNKFVTNSETVSFSEVSSEMTLSYRSLQDFKKHLDSFDDSFYDAVLCSMTTYSFKQKNEVYKNRKVRVDFYRHDAVSMEAVSVRLDKLWLLFYLEGPEENGVKNISWSEAERICWVQGMNMMIIQDESDLEKSASAVSYLLRKLPDLKVRSPIIPIGLRRNTKSVGKRFKWLKSTDHKFSQWAPHEPKYFPTKNCASWKWEVGTSSDPTHELGWRSEHCYNKNMPYVVCHQDVQPTIRVPKYIPEYGTHENSIFQKGAFSKDGPMYIAMQFVYFADGKNPANVSDFDLSCNGHPTSLLLFSQLCNGIVDCDSNSDEASCGIYGRANCSSHEWTCASKQCVPAEARCDLIQDCQDGSDEDSCEVCQHRMCPGGRCLPKSWFCDGVEDCVDGLDEAGCPVASEECVFLCNRTQCVTKKMLNDSVVDCAGPEGPIDETLGAMESVNCTQRNGAPIFNNWAPKCVLALDNFGEIIGCRDFQHLQDCQHFKCPPGYLKCSMSYCIPLAFYGDGKDDCPYGDDEEIESEIIDYSNTPSSARERKTLVTNAFLCDPFRIQGTSLSSICDGKRDCFNGADELNCGIMCPLGLICLSGFIQAVDKDIKLQSLESLDFIDHRVRYLDFSEIDMPKFFKVFPRGRLTHLLILKLSACNINSVTFDSTNVDTHDSSCDFTKAGADFRTIQKVDLSYNKLRGLPDCTYIGLMLGLRELNVSHNSLLSSVSDYFFSGLLELQVLDLSYTGIKYLDENIFDDLLSLSVLNLQAAPITSLDFVLPAGFNVLDITKSNAQHVSKHAFSKVRALTSVRASTYKVCCPQVLGAEISRKICLFDNDETASCDDLVEEDVLRAALFVMSWAILTGNGIALIYRLTWNKQLLKKPYGLFVTNLGVSDLLMGVYLIIITVKDSSYKGNYVLHDFPWRNSHACWIAGSLATLSSISSSLFLVLITADRFMAVRYPYGDHRFTSSTMLIAVLVAWLFGITVACLPLLPFAKGWAVFSTSSMCLGLPFHTSNLSGWIFSASVFIGVNFLLFFIIGAGQIAIFKTIRDKGKRSKRHTSNPNTQLRQNQRMQEYAIAKQLSLVVITNFVCLFPIILMGLMTIFGHEFGPASFRYTAIIILPVNAALNPGLYTLPAVRSKWSDFLESRKKAKIAKSAALKRRKDRGQTSDVVPMKVQLLIKCYRQIVVWKRFLQVEKNRGLVRARHLDRLKSSVDKLTSNIAELM